MAKRKSKKKQLVSIISTLAIVIVLASGLMMFLAIPNGDSLKASLEKDDYKVITDITESAFLPNGGLRQITMGKMINLQGYVVIITYFNSFGAAKDYYDNLSLKDNEKAYIRGKAVIRADATSAKNVRWKIWAF